MSTSSRDMTGSGGLGAFLQKKFLEQLSLECQKMAFCVVGNHVCIIDFHPGMEIMILPYNLYFENLKRLKLEFT